MADKYLTPNLTKEGLAMIVKALHGDSITFTKLVLGNGKPEDLDNVTEVANPLLNISFTEKTAYSDYLLLTGETTSASIEVSFYGKELGVYAKDDSNNEYLYAYRYTDNADYFPSSEDGRTLELRISVVVQVGTAENVTAILTEGEAYVLKSDFNKHVADKSNPHEVTKEQVGLGNVPNVTTDNQTPTFTQASSRTNIVSGENLSSMLGKIAKLFTDFASHLSARNPHSITCSTIGASATGHIHSTADITSGTLSVARGGTGTTYVGGIKETLHLGRRVSRSSSVVTANKGKTKSITSLILSPGKWLVTSYLTHYKGSGVANYRLTSKSYDNVDTSSTGVESIGSGCFIPFYTDGNNVMEHNSCRFDIIDVSSYTIVYLTVQPDTANMSFYGFMDAISIA